MLYMLIHAIWRELLVLCRDIIDQSGLLLRISARCDTRVELRCWVSVPSSTKEKRHEGSREVSASL